MSWFKHNGNASFDSRMMALQEAQGYLGIGIYWTMVERIECWGGGIYPRKRLLSELCDKRTTRTRLAQVLDNYDLFITLDSGYVTLQRNPKQSSLPSTTEGVATEETPEQDQRKDLSSKPQRACVNIEEKKDNNTPSLLDRYATEMAADRGEWHEMVCMKSGYSALLHRYWSQAVEQWRQHVISYSTAHEIDSLQRARYYFNSFIKLSTRSGQQLKATLQVLDARASQSAQSSVTQSASPSGTPPDTPSSAPPRPSPTAVWNPAKEEWSEFY